MAKQNLPADVALVLSQLDACYRKRSNAILRKTCMYWNARIAQLNAELVKRCEYNGISLETVFGRRVKRF